jgi:hypothetical protein
MGLNSFELRVPVILLACTIYFAGAKQAHAPSFPETSGFFQANYLTIKIFSIDII